MFENEQSYAGFDWINCNDSDNSTFSFIRKAKNPDDHLIFAVNFTPCVRQNYTLGVPHYVPYKEIFNSDSALYSGSNVGNGGLVYPNTSTAYGYKHSIRLTLPPLGGIILKPQFDK